MTRVYHGWIIVDEAQSGDPKYATISVEYQDETERRKHYMQKLGNSGCAQAVEWWDNKIGERTMLEPSFKGSYRVYTERKE